MIISVEKSGKILETIMLAWKMQMSVTLLITNVFVNFHAVHDMKHLKFKVHKFQSHSIRVEEYSIRVEEYTV